LVLDPRQLPDLSDKEKTALSSKIFEDSDPDSDSAVYDCGFQVYFPEFLWLNFKTPHENSMPRKSADAGRLRVACFLAGFFEPVIDYVSRDAYKNLAASFLYSKENSARRERFWEAVLKKTLKILSDNTQLYRNWLRIIHLIPIARSIVHWLIYSGNR
jgi:hypothetical protein